MLGLCWKRDTWHQLHATLYQYFVSFRTGSSYSAIYSLHRRKLQLRQVKDLLKVTQRQNKDFAQGLPNYKVCNPPRTLVLRKKSVSTWLSKQFPINPSVGGEGLLQGSYSVYGQAGQGSKDPVGITG